MIIKNAFKDTCMFIFGLWLGIILNYLFRYLDFLIQNSSIHNQFGYFIIGIIQILGISLIIQTLTTNISKNIGLFVLGILTPQILLIKKCFK